MFFKTTLGADIEMFVGKDKYELLDNTKICTLYNDYCMVENDGLALEIKPSYKQCREAITSNIDKAIEKIDSSFGILKESVHTFNLDDWMNFKDKDKELGCKPSCNVWEQWSLDETAKYIPTRSAGGHIHLGVPNFKLVFLEDHGANSIRTKNSSMEVDTNSVFKITKYNLHDFREEARYSALPGLVNHKKVKHQFLITPLGHALRDTENIVKSLDLYLGIPSVILDDKESQIQRRKVYGKAGEFRYTPYGLEYRTLSNFWSFDPRLSSYFLGMSRFAVNMNIPKDKLPKGSRLIRIINMHKVLMSKYENELPGIINNADQQRAAEILDDIYKSFKNLLPEDDYEVPMYMQNYECFKIIKVNESYKEISGMLHSTSHFQPGIHSMYAHLFHNSDYEDIKEKAIKDIITYDKTFNLR